MIALGRQRVDVTAIVVDRDLQLREGMHEETVQDYVDALADGADFPPVTLFRDISGALRLADGFHRVEAARRWAMGGGDGIVAADVLQGGRTDALLWAAGSNASHGLRRTNGDKRRAVGALIREWPQWSDRRIAELAHVTHPFVAKVRAELVAAGEVEAVTTRVGKDGREQTAIRAPAEEAQAEEAPVEEAPIEETPAPWRDPRNMPNSHDVIAPRPGILYAVQSARNGHVYYLLITGDRPMGTGACVRFEWWVEQTKTARIVQAAEQVDGAWLPPLNGYDWIGTRAAVPVPDDVIAAQLGRAHDAPPEQARQALAARLEARIAGLLRDGIQAVERESGGRWLLHSLKNDLKNYKLQRLMALDRDLPEEELDDAGEQLEDAGEQLEDAGEQLEDAGGQLDDASEVDEDAGEQLDDARDEPEAADEPEPAAGEGSGERAHGGAIQLPWDCAPRRLELAIGQVQARARSRLADPAAMTASVVETRERVLSALAAIGMAPKWSTYAQSGPDITAAWQPDLKRHDAGVRTVVSWSNATITVDRRGPTNDLTWGVGRWRLTVPR